MEYIEAFFHSASYLGGIEQLMALSTTDIAMLFLLSKPAFILTAVVVVATNHQKATEQALFGDEPRGQLPAE